MPDEAPDQREVLGTSPIFTREVINDIHMKAELGRYRMRGFSMFKKLPGWDDLIFLPGTLTRFVIEGYRERCDTKTVLGSRFAKKPLELDIPVYITGMSFGALSLEAKMALAKGASMAGHRDLLGGGGHDPARARSLDQVVLPGDPEPVRVQPAPPDAGRRDRVLHRPGVQGRPRRPSDGPEGDRAGRRDALAAGRDRPEVPGAAPRLARPRRPLAEGPGDARGDQLRGPDPAQARGRARLRRRPHGGQVRPGHHLSRRGGGRHRRRPAHRRRGDRDPAAGGDPGGAPGAGGRRARRRGRSRGRRRDPQRRRHRQVPGARGRRDRDRPLGADGPQLQQGDPRGHRLRGNGGRSRPASATTATPVAARLGSRRRTRSCASACTSRTPRSGCSTSSTP